MQKLIAFFRREIVLTCALAAALLSMVAVPPDAAYISYIDADVLMLLFSLMTVVAGLKQCALMDLCAMRLCCAREMRGRCARC